MTAIYAVRKGYIIVVDPQSPCRQIDIESFSESLDGVRNYGGDWYSDSPHSIHECRLNVLGMVENVNPQEPPELPLFKELQE